MRQRREGGFQTRHYNFRFYFAPFAFFAAILFSVAASPPYDLTAENARVAAIHGEVLRCLVKILSCSASHLSLCSMTVSG